MLEGLLNRELSTTLTFVVHLVYTPVLADGKFPMVLLLSRHPSKPACLLGQKHVPTACQRYQDL